MGEGDDRRLGGRRRNLEGRLFRCVCRAGKCWGDGVTERVVWHVVKEYAKGFGITQLAPHDLRRYAA